MTLTEKVNKIGLYNTDFKMQSEDILEKKIETIRGQESKFEIIAGRMTFNNYKYNKTFVLEVHYRDSEEAHSRKLPLNGFNSGICFDYMEKATELAEKFCEEHNFVFNTHLNSWPIYQAIISKE